MAEAEEAVQRAKDILTMGGWQPVEEKQWYLRDECAEPHLVPESATHLEGAITGHYWRRTMRSLQKCKTPPAAIPAWQLGSSDPDRLVQASGKCQAKSRQVKQSQAKSSPTKHNQAQSSKSQVSRLLREAFRIDQYPRDLPSIEH